MQQDKETLGMKQAELELTVQELKDEVCCCPSSSPGAGGFGTRPWWLALLACGGAYWPLALEPSAMTSRHPHCRGPAWGGLQIAISAMASSPDGLISPPGVHCVPTSSTWHT